ncbi:hypothetical protein AB1E18_012770 [Capra hircus]
MNLTNRVLQSFRVAKVFHENSDKINCFDFSPNGEMVISSNDDNSIVLYDCQEGKPKRTPYTPEDMVAIGIDCISFSETVESAFSGVPDGNGILLHFEFLP